MRSSKKRKLEGIRTKPLNVVVAEKAYEKLGKMAGPESLAATVETLIEREYRRREKKLSLQVQESSC